MEKYKKTSYSFKNEEDILNFGTYKDSTILDIMVKSPEYIDWCILNFKEFKLSKKLKIKFEELKNK